MILKMEQVGQSENLQWLSQTERGTRVREGREAGKNIYMKTFSPEVLDVVCGHGGIRDPIVDDGIHRYCH